jgi:hypothetical protein
LDSGEYGGTVESTGAEHIFEGVIEGARGD